MTRPGTQPQFGRNYEDVVARVRTFEELNEIERDIIDSQPLQPLTPEDFKRLGIEHPLKGSPKHVHEIQFALTNGGRLVRLKGAKEDSGSTTLWSQDEEYAIPYERLPERNRAAYLLSKFLGIDIMPVTVLRTNRQGDRFISGTAQEWMWGEMSYGVEDCSMEQHVLAWIFEFIVYNRDRNIGSKMVRKKDRKILTVDMDFTGKAPKPGDDQAFPPRIKPPPSPREVNPPYGESPPPDFVERMIHLNNQELAQLEYILRQEELLDEDEIKALRNRLVFIASLLRQYGTIPRIVDKVDYLGHSRFYNSGKSHLEEIMKKVSKNQSKKVAA